MEIEGEKEKYKANSLHNLDALIEKKKSLLNAKKSAFQSLLAVSKKIVPKSSTQSKVVYYKGITGLKRSLWNTVNADRKIYTIIHPDFDDILNFNFYDRVREEFVAKGIKLYELTNQKVVPSFTNIEEFASSSHLETRHIPETDLKIKFEVQIYNDVYVMYYFRDEDIVCIEIHNKGLAKMQKQLFENLWHKAKPMKITNKQGQAKVF